MITSFAVREIGACESLTSFFFQAEDGIRDADVTGVQTCALPISPRDDAGGGRHRLRARRRPLLSADRQGGAHRTAARADSGDQEPAREHRGRSRPRGGRGSGWPDVLAPFGPPKATPEARFETSGHVA